MWLALQDASNLTARALGMNTQLFSVDISEVASVLSVTKSQS